MSCPEFLKEGSAVKDFLEPDRVVIGDDGDWAGDAVEALYAPLDAPIIRTDVKSAEMVKLASNAFLATKISFINEIANVCEETGADVVEVARGMGLDDRIGPKFLQAGIGFGGSCFAPGETVLARVRGQARLLRFEQLWAEMDGGDAEAVAGGRPRGALVGAGRGRARVHAGLAAHAARSTPARWSRCGRRRGGACARPRTTRSSSATARERSS